ncbi:hypothetical protein SAMN05443247_08894 [Bradyrhizobium erythrophlei]|nr:hypothetical protein SAMN05443247_08894 [Bradyrhizobium erythrophlei]
MDLPTKTKQKKAESESYAIVSQLAQTKRERLMQLWAASG